MSIATNTEQRTIRVKLQGGPLDGKYAQILARETQFTIGGVVYTRGADSKIAQYIEPDREPDPLPEPTPARHVLGPNDCVVLEYPGWLTVEQSERARESLTRGFGVDPKRVLVLDGGAKISTLTKTAPLPESRINEMAVASGLTRDQAPEWFAELVRAVEAEHLIGGGS